MATATALQVVVSPFLGVLFENITSLIKSEVALIWGVQKQMKRLSRTLSTIRDVLHDAEEKQLTNDAITNWLDELKDAAYDAEDVLEECAFDGLQFASETKNSSFAKQVTDSFKQVKLRHKIGKRIKELTERFDEIAERKQKFDLKATTAERRPKVSHDRETSSMLDDPEVLGRDEDRDNLVRLLLNNVNIQEDISICSIIGIGGLGKTTLAQLVYNDKRVAEHFEPRAWVCVSEDFDVKRLVKAILASVSGRACDLEELDPIKRKLEEKLHGKRFLLVLDDVWNENQDNWDKLKGSLQCGAKGSSVIVTTRLETIASITSTRLVYHLEVLSEDNCWSLFKKRAFGSMNEERPDLEEIGKVIVKKCGGVPLAAKALGGMLRFTRDENKWLSVRDNEIWDLPQSNENNILPALRLSYNHLPSHLRQCFAYCAIFPKDHRIRKERLIRLWMANGLVQSEGGMEMEDVGNDIFNSLLMRSFFQDVEKDEDGNVETCKMHDLVHDLACHIAKGECFIMDTEKVENFTRRIRHLSVDCSTHLSSSKQVKSILKFSPCLRSLVKFNVRWPIQNLQFFFSNLKCLRALDLCGTSVTELPNSISKMKHLRYLDLSYSGIESLPKSICRLRNLQTLDLTCTALKTWPRDMRKISSIRHLEIQGCRSLANMPIEMGKLSCLRTLSLFIVGSESGYSIKELQGLNQLGGKLEIKKLENVRNSSDAKEANLVRKENLRLLSLSWSEGSLQENALEVIEGLQPHSKLRRLDIDRYQGISSPNWLKGSSSLPYLVEISLSNWKNCDQVSLGKLPQLKILKMEEMGSLKFIDNGVYGEGVVKGFPSLEKLELHWMHNLERWSSSQSKGELFPCLREMILHKCPKLITVSTGEIPHLKFLKMYGMESLKFIDDGVYGEGGVKGFPSLEKLELSGMPNLERWSSSQSQSQSQSQGELFPCIRELIVSCPKLIIDSLPSSLQSVEVWKCNERVLRSLQNLPCLSKLEIWRFDELEYFPEGMLRNLIALKELEIGDCKKVKALPVELENLTALRRLTIFGCGELVSMPEGLRNLSSLKSLQIGHCHGIQKLEISNNSSLEELNIIGCYGLKHLTELSGISNLESLQISNCSKLEIFADDLWHEAVLQRLQLYGLPQLTCLPEGIKDAAATLQELTIKGCPNLMELPEWMQHLTHLQQLEIVGCNPELERRCDINNGQDWYKISHIPNLHIE